MAQSGNLAFEALEHIQTGHEVAQELESARGSSFSTTATSTIWLAEHAKVAQGRAVPCFDLQAQLACRLAHLIQHYRIGVCSRPRRAIMPQVAETRPLPQSHLLRLYRLRVPSSGNAETLQRLPMRC